MWKILLALDGSEGSTRATHYAARLAKDLPDAEVTALFVKDLTIREVAGDFVAVGGDFTLEMAGVEKKIEERASENLEGAQSILQGTKVATRSVWGEPATIICNVAEMESFDLVIMGSRGLGQLSGILLGSVSDRVVHRSKVPVLIVR